MLIQNKPEFAKGQYQTAYHLLFNRITDALAEEELSAVREILTDAQQRAEEVLLEGKDQDCICK